MMVKLFLLFALFGIVHMAPSLITPEPSSSGLFAADLFREIATTKINENVVFSPISVQVALGMAYLGAKGETAKELEKGVRLPSNNKTVVAESFAQVLAEKKGQAQLEIANQIFVDSGYKLSPTFNALAQKYFQSKAETVNFSDSSKAIQIVNDWIEEKTKNKISNMLQPGSVGSDTSALIVNAIYFKGKWQTQFSKDSTTKLPFWVSTTKSVHVDTMYEDGYFKYGDLTDLDASAIQMPYKDSDLSMVLILPNERDGLTKLEEKLSSVAVNELASRLTKQNVDVFLPKFKIEFSVPLVGILKKLGIQSIFGSGADLSDLFESGPKMRISDIKQKALIDVNEAGSEATAATIMKISPMSLNLNQKKFNADHPFVFAITTQETVYFIGHVANF